MIQSEPPKTKATINTPKVSVVRRDGDMDDKDQVYADLGDGERGESDRDARWRNISANGADEYLIPIRYTAIRFHKRRVRQTGSP